MCFSSFSKSASIFECFCVFALLSLFRVASVLCLFSAKASALSSAEFVSFPCRLRLHVRSFVAFSLEPPHSRPFTGWHSLRSLALPRREEKFSSTISRGTSRLRGSAKICDPANLPARQRTKASSCFRKPKTHGPLFTRSIRTSGIPSVAAPDEAFSRGACA